MPFHTKRITKQNLQPPQNTTYRLLLQEYHEYQQHQNQQNAPEILLHVHAHAHEHVRPGISVQTNYGYNHLILRQ